MPLFNAVGIQKLYQQQWRSSDD